MVDYTMETVDELRNMQRGDQIGLSYSINKVSYFHFGIYLGPNEGVAEFGDDYLRIVDLFKFKGDSKLFRAVYQPDQCLASEEVAKRAEDFVKNPQSWGTYSLLTNNSEHFATYCKTGKAFSKQVEDNILIGKVVDYTLETVDELRNIQRGDQIGVLCSINKVLYFHFGIYLGPNEGVAEFGRDYLRIVDLFKFKEDSKLFRAVYQPDQCLASEAVAKRAEYFVKNPQRWGTYGLLTNNCEHFATYCKTGKAFSKQVNIQRGDQIGVLCSNEKIPSVHFGIYLGAMVGVAEFGGSYLRVVDLFKFQGDSKLVRAVYQPDQCLASEEVAKRAEDFVKNPQSWGIYSLLTNNCEHFATYCKTGMAFSKQVGDNVFVGKVVFKSVDFTLKAVGSVSKPFFQFSSDSFSSSS